MSDTNDQRAALPRTPNFRSLPDGAAPSMQDDQSALARLHRADDAANGAPA